MSSASRSSTRSEGVSDAGDVVAHAYLFYPDSHELTPEAGAPRDARRPHRLAAGFAIAMRDLEIRGAGNLLGAEQSGHVAAIGFELYVEMLGEAVAELGGWASRGGRSSTDAQVDAYIPAAYIAAEAAKISTSTGVLRSPSRTTKLRELRAAVEDRWPDPEPVEHLFAIKDVRLRLARLGADYLVLRGGRATVGPLARLGAGCRSTASTPPSIQAPSAR